jgi:hypothetical protein
MSSPITYRPIAVAAANSSVKASEASSESSPVVPSEFAPDVVAQAPVTRSSAPSIS